MARAKKKELTPEERLREALVPIEEQPYQIPENWKWVKLGKIYEVNPKNDAPDDIDAAFIPMEKIMPGMISEFTFDTQNWAKAKKGHTQFADGDVAFAKISPCFENRKSMIVSGLPNGIGGGTTELIILRNPEILQAYTFWLVSSEDFIRRGVTTYSGTVGQQRISMDFVKNYPIPLPPFTEQQRIVDRIESLFAQLDKAKEKIQEAIRGFEDRRSAILHRAFSGELTASWRNEHNEEFTSWKRVKSQDVCEKITCGKTPTGYISAEGEIPYLKVYNIVNNMVDFETTPQYIPQEISKGKLSSSELQPHDVIMNIVGPPLRKIAIVPDTFPSWNMNQAIVRFRPKECLNYEFLYYMLVYPSTLDEAVNATRGVVGQANISVSQSRTLDFVIPSLAEQKEIVRRIKQLLDKESQALLLAHKVNEEIDLIKKSILAKAFRGELGTNDITELAIEKLTE